MGANCETCNTCSDQIYDIVNGEEHMLDYQRHAIKHKDLDKYDKFYRTVGVPFIEMGVDEFFSDLQILEQKYFKLKEERGLHGHLDNIPYVMFLEYFKVKHFWEV